MITIKDVAERARVSFTTVSHVVNGTRSVSEDSRKRVLQAIKELRYVPSAAARSLKINRTFTIGLITSNSSNPFFAEVVRGVEDTCYEAGFNVILCNSDDSPNKQRRYMRVLNEKQVDGLIVMSSGFGVELAQALQSVVVPCVEVDRDMDDVAVDMVQVDHEFGAHLAMAHLLSLGHRRIACIAGPQSLSPALQRVRGYKNALAAANIDVPEGFMRESDFTSAGGYRAMIGLLNLPERPTAVFAGNDLMAIGAICAAAEAGLRIPADLSIVGFDDIALAAYTNPPLTTIAQPMNETGRLAARVLIDRIERPSGSPQREVLKPSLRVRQSSGLPPHKA